jgi:hypothetical protein
MAAHASKSIITFADDTTVVGLITNDNKTALQGGEGSGNVLPEKQPLTQRQQNKGDDCGLQETAEAARPVSTLMGPQWRRWNASSSLVYTSLTN